MKCKAISFKCYEYYVWLYLHTPCENRMVNKVFSLTNATRGYLLIYINPENADNIQLIVYKKLIA
jgi:hypothetical protein